MPRPLRRSAQTWCVRLADWIGSPAGGVSAIGLAGNCRDVRFDCCFPVMSRRRAYAAEAARPLLSLSGVSATTIIAVITPAATDADQITRDTSLPRSSLWQLR